MFLQVEYLPCAFVKCLGQPAVRGGIWSGMGDSVGFGGARAI